MHKKMGEVQLCSPSVWKYTAVPSFVIVGVDAHVSSLTDFSGAACGVQALTNTRIAQSRSWQTNFHTEFLFLRMFAMYLFSNLFIV